MIAIIRLFLNQRKWFFPFFSQMSKRYECQYDNKYNKIIRPCLLTWKFCRSFFLTLKSYHTSVSGSKVRFPAWKTLKIIENFCCWLLMVKTEFKWTLVQDKTVRFVLIWLGVLDNETVIAQVGCAGRTIVEFTTSSPIGLIQTAIANPTTGW